MNNLKKLYSPFSTKYGTSICEVGNVKTVTTTNSTGGLVTTTITTKAYAVDCRNDNIVYAIYDENIRMDYDTYGIYNSTTKKYELPIDILVNNSNWFRIVLFDYACVDIPYLRIWKSKGATNLDEISLALTIDLNERIYTKLGANIVHFIEGWVDEVDNYNIVLASVNPEYLCLGTVNHLYT